MKKTFKNLANKYDTTAVEGEVHKDKVALFYSNKLWGLQRTLSIRIREERMNSFVYI